jgi:hypothetical protein
VILEFEFIRQQVFFLIFLYYCVGLQIYAIKEKDMSVFYLTGLLSLFGAAIHPAFLIITLSWILALTISHLKTFWRHKYKFILIAALAFPLAEKTLIVNMYIRIYEQASASFKNLIAGNWNMKFPAYFINSDTYEMSWPGLSGVVKYYSFYAGPIALATLVIFVILFPLKPNFRKQLLLNPAKPSLFILIPTLLFFIIAEIAPRFGNIAFLPDRAWQYLSILFIFPLFIILSFTSRYLSPLKAASFPLLFVLFAVITFSGAAYVNNLTQYTIPDYEFTASRWILDNTPEGSFIYSGSSKNLIRYHSQRKFIGFDPSLYNEQNPANIINHLSSQIDLESEISSNLTLVSGLLADISNRATSSKASLDTAIKYRSLLLDSYDALDTVFQKLELSIKQARENAAAARDFHNLNKLTIDNLPPIYIYYSQTHPKNPYSSRPYKSTFTANLELNQFSGLDDKPNLFERVYTDDNKVIIWHVKTFNLNQS